MVLRGASVTSRISRSLACDRASDFTQLVLLMDVHLLRGQTTRGRDVQVMTGHMNFNEERVIRTCDSRL